MSGTVGHFFFLFCDCVFLFLLKWVLVFIKFSQGPPRGVKDHGEGRLLSKFSSIVWWQFSELSGPSLSRGSWGLAGAVQ